MPMSADECNKLESEWMVGHKLEYDKIEPDTWYQILGLGTTRLVINNWVERERE